jgi:hypothetical protein
MTRKDYGSGDAVTEDQLRDMLRSRIGWHGGKRVFAKDLAAQFGVCQAYLSDVLNNRRGIADKLANALGYQRVVIFRKSDAPQSLQEQPSC